MKIARRRRRLYFTLTECLFFIIFYSIIISIVLISSDSNVSQVTIMDTINKINEIKTDYDRFTLKYGKNIEEIEKTIVVDTNVGIQNPYNEFIISKIPLNESRYFAIMNLNKEPHLFIGINNQTLEVKNDTLTPLEAFIIDNKLDDGLPNDGKIKVFNKDVNNDCYYNNYYNTKNKKRVCTLISIIK